MKTLALSLVMLALASCASHKEATRKISSLDRDLTGTYLAVADYGKGHQGLNKKAIRIYFAPIESEPGKYNVVILEYVDLLRMAPSYIVSNKLPFIAKATGFLNHITDTAAAYEAVPGEKENTFELRPLVVSGNQIVVKADAKPRILTLSEKEGLESALAGATITASNDSEPKEIFFPSKNDGKKPGLQYGTAKAAYEKAKLESTWRKSYLRGPYLSQYYRRDDVVLHCTGENEAAGGEFVLGGDKYQKMSAKKRTAMFTHPDSAFLKGNFTVTEPRDGMFLFHSVDADERSAGVLKNKIGMFIDVFDATKSLNQDVVELVFADSEKPRDFLMYYEDPKNGEGKENGVR